MFLLFCQHIKFNIDTTCWMNIKDNIQISITRKCQFGLKLNNYVNRQIFFIED